MSLPDSLCFIDVETSGLNASYNRIIEIGLLKVKKGELVKEFKTFLNPQSYVDPFIETMTGIKSSDLELAPSFYEIKDELLELLEDSIFVAHNVRFDYGFIRNEFKRAGVKYSSKHFDTIKLAKILYPNLPRYGLDSLIQNFNFECKNRHRAFDDAKVLWDFYSMSQKSVHPDLFLQAVNTVLKKPTLPINLDPKIFENLSENAGVYIFYGKSGEVLYIGKSVCLKDRIYSHFSNDHLSSTDMKISQEICSIETVDTAGELGALLLESTLIKKHQPIYNKLLRVSRKMPILLRTSDENGYNSVQIKELDQIDVSELPNFLIFFMTLNQTK